jgi:O-antigen ligase
MIETFNLVLQSPRARQAAQGIGILLFALWLIHLSLGWELGMFLMAIFVGIGAFFFLWKPHVGIVMILILSFLEGSPLAAGIRQFNGQYLIGAFLVIPFALSIFCDRKILVWQVPQVRIFVAIGVLFLISTWWSNFKYPVTLIPEIDRTATMLQAFARLLLFFVLFVYFINTRPRIVLMVWILVGLIVVTALSAMLPFLEGEEIRRARASFGIGENSNRLAFMSIFGVSLLWFYYSYGQGRWQKWLMFPLMLFLSATALASGSRSGLLQLLILAAIVITDQKGWSVAKRMQSILLVGLVVLLLLAVVPAGSITRITSYDTDATDSMAGGESLRQRIRTIYALMDMATSNPILGIGLGNFAWMHKVNYGLSNTPHNSYLWMLTEGGVGVLVLYLILFRITYRMLRELETEGPSELMWLSKGLRVNLILFLVFSAFANFWLEVITYSMLGLVVSMNRVWKGRSQDFVLTPQILPAV